MAHEKSDNETVERQQKGKRSALHTSSALNAQRILTPKQQASDEAKEGIKRIEAINQQYKNANEVQIAGRVAEECHATSANVDARLKGLKDKFETSNSIGKSTKTGDIYHDGVPVAEVKFHKNAKRNATQSAQEKYRGLQRVVPEEDVESAKSYCKKVARKNATRNPEKASLRNETAENITDRVRVKSKNGKAIESKPLSRDEAIKIKRDPQKLEALAPEPTIKDQALEGLKSGVLVSAVLSLAGNAKEAIEGTKSVSQAVKDTAKDTAVGGGRSVVTMVGTAAVRKGLATAGAKNLAKGSLPAVIFTTCLETAGDAVDFHKGKIDGKEFAIRGAKNVGSAASGWACAEAGAAIGTFICPGVGTAVGAIGFGIIGCLGFNKLFG